MAGADLQRAVDLLRLEHMDKQFQLLGARPLLVELRSAVSTVHSNGTVVSKGANQRLMFLIQSLAAPLRALLDEVLRAKIRAKGWRQVPAAILFSNRFSRLNTTLHELRQFSHKFRALASYVSQVDSSYCWMYSSTSPYSIGGVRGPTDALQSRMVGRWELLDKMVDVVLAGTGGGRLLVLPFVGGPGVGKTRLAMALLNDGRVRRKFALRLALPFMPHRHYSLDWVLMRISSHSNGDQQHTDPHEAANNELRIQGDFLILLDDVWADREGNCPVIGALMKALPSNGSLVVTTRTPAVASYLATAAEATSTTRPLYLQPLEQEFSSSFVAEWIDAYRGDWPTELIRGAGTAIAGKCGGVPILLDHARERFCQPQGLEFWQGFLKKRIATDIYFWGQLLACIGGLPDEEFWRRFLGHSGESPDGNAVLESAALSYQHLPSDIRSCLLYCSLFPSGHDFDVEELTDLLATEGYIPSIATKAQRKGFLQQFLDECFYPLQEHEYGDRCTYRMHKVLHIFAQFMDRKTSSVIRVDQAVDELATEATSQQSLISVQRASLIVNPSSSSFPTSLFKCKHLGTLILLFHEGSMCPPDQRLCEITEIPKEIFERPIQVLSLRGNKIKMLPTKFLDPFIYNVKYLNLSQTDIESIPSSISRLMFLQTLILSHCNKLQKLHPNTTKLARLLKLDLEGCFNLFELPRHLSEMRRLEYLNVIECSSLTQLPRGMAQLERLQMLLGYIVSYPDGSSLSDLQPLANLHRLSLQRLEKWNMDDYSDDTIPAYAVFESLRPHRHLKALEIVGYDGEKLPSWITGPPYLMSLVELKLINLRSYAKVLPTLGLLPYLKIVEINGAETISSINDSFYGSTGTFPSLEKLTFSYMHNLEIWEEVHQPRPDMFPRLTELAIIQCPKLRALHMELPSLEKLIVWLNNKIYGLKGALGGVAKTLEHISISFAEELLASSDCEGLQDLGKLTKLEICGCDELTCLPQGLQHLSSIKSLTIDNCTKLEIVPDWLENLPSLQILRLSGCPLLHYIPGGLGQRLGVIVYVEDCPNLVQEQPNVPSQSSGSLVSTKGKEIVIGDV